MNASRPALLLFLVACGKSAPARDEARAPSEAGAGVAEAKSASPSPGLPGRPNFTPVALPGAAAPASIDYIAFESGRSRVWVPVGGTGSVDVYDTGTSTFVRVDGFATAERERMGQKRTVGPSAVSIGDGAAYVGNRATSEVCPVDTATLKLATCLKLDSPTDGVAYVGTSKEVWVTTPRDRAIVVLDASTPLVLKPKTVIHIDGAPEGYAVDSRRGLFFTNLEDKNKTVVLDVASHTPKATWNLACNADGPRGVAADARGLVYVACTDKVLVLDGVHDGANLGAIETGSGVDNIDFVEPLHALYVAAGKAATLTVARIDDHGRATKVVTNTTVQGARNGVADDHGNVYVPDPMNARLLVFSPRE
jgi:hypothetical protein